MSVVAAELLKLRRAWSTWILVGLLALAQLLLGYLFIFAAIQAPDDAFGGTREFFRATLLTENVVSNALTMLSGLGGALALVLGSMSSAREYGWRTITTLLTQRPTRTGYLAGKVQALAMLTLTMVLVTFAIAAMASLLVTSALGEEVRFPPIDTIVFGLAAAWLMLGAWACVGFALGLLFRSTGLAIGLGLVYALVIESVLQLLTGLGEPFITVSRGLLGVNATALAASFGPDVPDEFGAVSIEPIAATAVLAAYVVLSLLISGYVFLRRDVT
jgi:ABC-type transport system involved in multi-copper enzyme maturation permease subunit